MNATTLDAAIREAQRFLDRAMTVKADPSALQFYGCKAKTAALRRASMDLTRALAELRKAN